MLSVAAAAKAARELASVDDILFLIVGNGVTRDRLEVYAGQLGLRSVRFLSFQPHEVVPEMYASSDVCLVTLRKGFTSESVPSKVFTIMASGRPMIASLDEDSDTWRFVQNTQCGLCVEPENPRALAEAIRTLYASTSLRKTLGTNGRKCVVQRFTRRAVAGQYHDLLTSVVR